MLNGNLFDIFAANALRPHPIGAILYTYGSVSIRVTRATVLLALLAGQAFAAEDRDAVRFFEERVRPILAANCLGCHNEDVKTSGLSLAASEDAMLGGNRGSSVIPNQPNDSLLIQAVARTGDLKMPPAGPLPPDEVAVLSAWIANGATWGEASKPSERATGTHWSFQPIRRADPPEIAGRAWARNPIDRFVLAKLESEGIEPSAEANRRTLIRRVSLDLVGLPPTPREVSDFLADEEPGGYERLVDRLLASSHYGERWGRHWLDIARYADSNGYSIDSPRQIWKYRDWVINAFNADMSFDQFTIEQLAGDLLPDPTIDQKIATGLQRNTMVNEEGGIDFEQYRVEAVVDRVNTIGAGYLGLTVGCARCHDHKFDPISQREFYQLYAFFNNVDERSGEFEEEAGRKHNYEPVMELGTPEEFEHKAVIESQLKMLEQELAEYEATLDKKQLAWEANLTDEERSEIPRNITDLIAIPRGERLKIPQQRLTQFYRDRDTGWSARMAGIKGLRSARPKMTTTLVMRELPKPRQAYIHQQGDFTQRGEEVEPGTLAVLPPLPSAKDATRLDLARWLVSPENPLTPRVTVNRVWQRYFGTGLVETENDFGSQGSAPSHPELLDWLAADFVSNGMSLKHLHRRIVTSATYRQASAWRPELADIDPSNRLLARQSRLRLEAEIVRDAGLTVSGLLNPEVGGPSVFPPQPDGANQFTQVDRGWQTETGPNRYRRGMYTFFQRSSIYPGLALFDSPTAQTSATRRDRTNTPLQALTLLNDKGYMEFAEGLARQTLEVSGNRDDRIRFAFERSLSRKPLAQESQRLGEYVARMLDEYQSDGEEEPELAAWTAASRILLNLDEFVTRQ